MIRHENQSGNQLPTSGAQYSELFRERFSTVIAELGGLKKAGEVAGVTDEQVAKWRDGKSKPSFFSVAEMAQAVGRSVDWLISNQDPSLGTGTFLTSFVQGGDDLTLVPRLEVQAAAGNGAVNYSEETAGFMAFQAAWLLEHGINPRFARILTATGDSMEPTIRDGDLLLVDTSIDQLVNHGIYVIIFSGLLLVKRVTKRLDGSVLIRSDNRAAYDDEIITAEHAVDLVIAGRVRWAGRTL